MSTFPSLDGATIIDDSNAHLFKLSGGYEGRDWNAVPLGSVPCAPVSKLPQIPRTDWDGMIEEGKAKGLFLTHLFKREEHEVKFQANTLFCVSNSVAAAFEITATKQGVPKERRKKMSPASIACIATNFQNKGHWPIQAIEIGSTLGMLPDEEWGSNTIDRSLDTPKSRELRKKYQIGETSELPRFSFEHLMSAVLRRHATPAAFMWMEHCVCAFAPEKVGHDAYAIWCLNSHGVRSGHGGYMLIAEDRAKPDEAISIRTVKPY